MGGNDIEFMGQCGFSMIKLKVAIHVMKVKKTPSRFTLKRRNCDLHLCLAGLLNLENCYGMACLGIYRYPGVKMGVCVSENMGGSIWVGRLILLIVGKGWRKRQQITQINVGGKI